MEGDDFNRRKIVLLALYHKNIKDPGAPIDNQDLERLAHISSTEVARCIAYLSQKGYAAVENHFGGGFIANITASGIDAIENPMSETNRTPGPDVHGPNNGTSYRISELTRRQILDMMLLRSQPFHGRIGLVEFLSRIWDLSSMRSSDPRFRDAAGDIHQHMVRNSDWDYEYLVYEYLRIHRCDDETFAKFVEISVHPLVLRDSEQISSAVAEINELLKNDGCMLEVASYLSGRPVYKVMCYTVPPPKAAVEEYDVMLSLAGEDRDYVEQVARVLTESGAKIFYDRYEEDTLWGKDMLVHFQEVVKRARYFLPFISKYYVSKVWPTVEAKAALARAISEKREFVLPARFDDSELPGLLGTIGYIDLRNRTPEEFARIVLKKIRQTG